MSELSKISVFARKKKKIIHQFKKKKHNCDCYFDLLMCCTPKKLQTEHKSHDLANRYYKQNQNMVIFEKYQNAILIKSLLTFENSF